MMPGVIDVVGVVSLMPRKVGRLTRLTAVHSSRREESGGTQDGAAEASASVAG